MTLRKRSFLFALILSLSSFLNMASANESVDDDNDSGIYMVMAAALIESCTDTYPQLNGEASAFWQIVRESEQREGKREGVIRQTVRDARAQCGNKKVSLTSQLCQSFIQTIAGEPPVLTTAQEKELSHALNTEIPAMLSCQETSE